MSKRKKSAHRSGKVTTPLAGHKKIGKALVPPFMQMKGISFSSWANERLPELLWACLVIKVVPRREALEVFRDIAAVGIGYRSDDQNSKAKGWTLNHSDLANQPNEIIEAIVVRTLRTPIGMQALRPLLLLDNLPGIDKWRVMLSTSPVEDDWQTLAEAVQGTFDHQSQEATDVRWVSVLFRIALGELMFPKELEERVLEIVEYPNKGDMRQVRPSIRAMEMSTKMSMEDEPESEWPEQFWKDVLGRTDCMPAPLMEREKPTYDSASVQRELIEVRSALLEHWQSTLSTTGLNPKHDAVFGFGFFALSCLMEMSMGILGDGVSGRLLLRALTESRISLAYLIRCGDDATWSKFRSYGAGQAKLALLKHEEMTGEKPRFVAMATLEALANEDYFQEYVEIDLGHWCNKDLRRMADESDTKDDYNRYYGWASGYVHGQWSAMRDSNFTHCLNPLHRFHRVPLPFHRRLENTISDALLITNSILDDVDSSYPGFNSRFSVETTSKDGETDVHPAPASA